MRGPQSRRDDLVRMRSSDWLISSWSSYSWTYPSFSGRRSPKGSTVDLVTQNKTGSLTLTKLRNGELRMVFEKYLLYKIKGRNF
jgi:hypothetical protein